MGSKADGDYMAVAPIPGNGTMHRLDVSTTAATYTALPRGLYTVMLDGVTSVLLRNDGSAAAEPASGASGTGGGHQSGWTYEHNISAGTGDLSAVVLNSGSGRLYLIRQP